MTLYYSAQKNPGMTSLGNVRYDLNRQWSGVPSSTTAAGTYETGLEVIGLSFKKNSTFDSYNKL